MFKKQSNSESAQTDEISIEQIRSLPGNEHRSDDELLEIRESLRELSLILYQIFSDSEMS